MSDLPKKPARPFENLDFPIVGSKIKVVVNFIYGYQNLSGDKYKTNGKELAQSDSPSWRKVRVPKTIRSTIRGNSDILSLT